MDYCQCGCNKPTNKIARSNPARGYVKGEYHRYLPGHNPTGYRTIEEQFWTYCAPGKPDTCWEWQSETMVNNGYGTFGFKGKKQYAHRVSYELHIGPIPDGMFVCHTCDNRKCVNPSHLFLGTNQDNVDDKVQKKRQLSGQKIRNAKLNSAIVTEMRQLFAQGTTYRDIADRYAVSLSVAWEAINRVTWKHVT